MSGQEIKLSSISLPELHRTLSEKVTALENLVQAQNHKIDDLANSQRINQASPLSIFARAGEAKSTVESFVESAKQERFEAMRGSPELYWKNQVLTATEVAALASIDEEALEYELQLLADVEERFRKLAPSHVYSQLTQSAETSGKVAVALSEAQGKNAELAYRLLSLEDDEQRIIKKIERAEVGAANAVAVTELCEFESRVLKHYLNAGSIPQVSSYPEGFGMPILEQLQDRKKVLTRDVAELEADLVTLRECLVKAIDASEHPQAAGLSRHLFANCENIIRKHSEDSHQGPNIYPF